MGISKIDVGVVERYAPSRGPTSSSDYNATLQEIINTLAQIQLSWNTELHPVLDSLPGGKTTFTREERIENPNAFLNGLDGSQVFLDLTSTSFTDDGKYYNEELARPLTVKESLESVQQQLNSSIQDLQVEIAQVTVDAGITSRQKQAIGARIFDPNTTSSNTSLDGVLQIATRNIDQIALDLSGDSNYLENNGAQSLQYALLEQLQAIQNAHSYNPALNTVTHNNIDHHEHKYNQTPVGDLNGVNRTYYTPGGDVFIDGSLRVIVNGLELRKNIHYTIHADRKGLDIAVAHRVLEDDASGANDSLWIHYDVEA